MNETNIGRCPKCYQLEYESYQKGYNDAVRHFIDIIANQKPIIIKSK